MYSLNKEFLVPDEKNLRTLFPATHSIAVRKCQIHLDAHAVDFISRSPFLCIGTQSAGGSADLSPRGDPPGFVKVLDSNTLLIPDRPGNNRLDTLANILSNPAVGLLFMIPGYDDTLRLNGHARISRDPQLLELTTANDRMSTVAIVVNVHEVFMHCAKAFRRSKLWAPESLQNRSDMPSLPKIIHDQTSDEQIYADDVAKMEAALEVEYQKTMY